MNSGLIGKVEKAHRYAQEPGRVRITTLTATFEGDNSTYDLAMEGDSWRCTCGTYQTFGNCQHAMATQQILQPMLPADAATDGAFPSASGASPAAAG